MSKSRFLIVGVMCLAMSGCILEGNDCDNCPLGCNIYGTDCALCDSHKCENGSLILCKEDRTGYEETGSRCDYGCNEEGTRCAACNGTKCENGQLSYCKEDRTGYEAGPVCVSGCNEAGTACNSACTEDVCKDGMIYRCHNSALSPQGEKCPDVAGTSGSCASGTACKQCDESVTSLRRRCISPTDYFICQGGLWSAQKLVCPDGQYCDDTQDGCSEKININNSCIDNDNGIGHVWTISNGSLLSEECANKTSCKDKYSCGDCLNAIDTKCSAETYYTCNHGEYQETACSLGLGCHENEDGKGVCNTCQHDLCENGVSKGGILKLCSNGEFNAQNECMVNGIQASCKSETECGECMDGTTACKGDTTVQTCQSGQWVNSKECEGETPICDAGSCVKEGTVCTYGEAKCNNNTLQICDNGKWNNQEECKGLMPFCDATSKSCVAEQCKEGEVKCYNNILQSCSKGGWRIIDKCDGLTPVCDVKSKSCVAEQTACTDGDTKCSNGTLQTCALGSWMPSSCVYGCYDDEKCNVCDKNIKECNDNKSINCLGYIMIENECSFGCNENTGDCYPDCEPGTKRCSNAIVQICSDDGLWMDDTNCDFGCNGKTFECYPECEPGTKKCEDSRIANLCNDNGKWKQVQCVIGCDNGECINQNVSCYDGEMQCSGNNIMQFCYKNKYIDIKCNKLNDTDVQCSDNTCSLQCDSDACIETKSTSGFLRQYIKFPCNDGYYDYDHYKVCSSSCKNC